MSVTATHILSPQSGDVLLIVGTVKGEFLFLSDRKRLDFRMSGPCMFDESIGCAAFIGGEQPRIFVGHKNHHWGVRMSCSDDFGTLWTTCADIKFPAGSDASLNSIWTLETETSQGPDVVLAGVDPAAMFRSDDRGETFRLNEALFNHLDRPKWTPSVGGLCLHSILVHPHYPWRIYAAISAGGIYCSNDRGASWNACVNGLRVNVNLLSGSLDDPLDSVCPHKLRFDAGDPSRMYLQSHPGVYRTDNEGRSWVSIATGLPSDFGFPLVAHPTRGGTIYTVPFGTDEFGVPLYGPLWVWRSRDAGTSWEQLGMGLPVDGFFRVLRDAFCADTLDPVGLYLGTRGGQLYGSNDEGESWRVIAEYLPPILCIKAAVIS